MKAKTVKPLPLKNCPFCGCKARVTEWSNGQAQVACFSIRCEATPFVDGKGRADAIRRWNKRA